MFSVEVIHEPMEGLIAPNGNHNPTRTLTLVWDFSA